MLLAAVLLHLLVNINLFSIDYSIEHKDGNGSRIQMRLIKLITSYDISQF